MLVRLCVHNRKEKTKPKTKQSCTTINCRCSKKKWQTYACNTYTRKWQSTVVCKSIQSDPLQRGHPQHLCTNTSASWEHTLLPHTHPHATQMRSLHCTQPPCKAHWSCTLLFVATFIPFYTLELLKNITNYFTNINNTITTTTTLMHSTHIHMHELVKAFNNIFPLHAEQAVGHKDLCAYRCH